MALLTQSYVHGASATPLLGETIGAMLRRVTAEGPGRIAQITRHQAVRWSYADLLGRAEDLAVGLRRLGLKPGDRIGVWAANCSEWVLAQFGTALAGLILVNINPAYRAHEFEYAVKKSGCRALILSPGHKSNDYFACLRSVAPEIDRAAPGRLKAAKLPKLEIVIRLGTEPTAGMFNFEDVAAPADEAERAGLAAFGATLQFDDPINIQFTSGTTGAPKGATLTHHNILNNGFFIGEAMRLTPADRLCIPVPYYHCFGMVLGNLACVTHGATMVSPSEGFDPVATLEAVEAEGCTGLHGVPTMFIAMLDHPEFDRFDLRTLRTGIMAGSPCPVEVMRRVIEMMHMREVTIAYGMTETSPVSFQSACDDPIGRRVSTVGRVQPHLEVKIVDHEGRIVPPGVAGELLTRGYSVMRGYWDDPAGTAAAIDPARFMHTGDLATIDAEGYCNIVGRLKDMVIRGGENIYPREIEEFLYTHPAIADVQAFGLPDPKYGEELCVWIRRRDGAALTEEEVVAFCKASIAHYKVPRYVRFVDEFPMTVTGKAQKFLMRKAMMDALALREEKTA
ncbi:fatty-acyl-CoA synthase [Roseiarcus fermentans]|uniref:3-methylmercaptopropionyl-CoA ligase n=1 Tax=Roseiarcus fermentans TaxID=1473586 RepID=A0A366F3H6_9HYPH|nr:fatty-acyl-CoA synthase [Roseiarcus fermentans]